MQTLNVKLTDSRRADVGSEVSGQDAARRKFSELEAEFARGQQQLAVLDQSRNRLRDTLLRISGAMEVLKELLQAESSPNGKDSVAVSDNRRSPAASTARIPLKVELPKTPAPAEKVNELPRGSTVVKAKT